MIQGKATPTKAQMRYSTKEKELFDSLGMGHLTETINPPHLYKTAAVLAFSDGREGKDVDSLRRCVRALEQCSPYRLTEEFDALISLN